MGTCTTPSGVLSRLLPHEQNKIPLTNFYTDGACFLGPHDSAQNRFVFKVVSTGKNINQLKTAGLKASKTIKMDQGNHYKRLPREIEFKRQPTKLKFNCEFVIRMQIRFYNLSYEDDEFEIPSVGNWNQTSLCFRVCFQSWKIRKTVPNKRFP